VSGSKGLITGLLAVTGVPVTGLFPGKAAIGPVKPTFSAGAGTSGLNATAEPTSTYKLLVSNILFEKLIIKLLYGLSQ